MLTLFLHLRASLTTVLKQPLPKIATDCRLTTLSKFLYKSCAMARPSTAMNTALANAGLHSVTCNHKCCTGPPTGFCIKHQHFVCAAHREACHQKCCVYPNTRRASFCQACRKFVNSFPQFADHINGKKHLKRLRQTGHRTALTAAEWVRTTTFSRISRISLISVDIKMLGSHCVFVLCTLFPLSCLHGLFHYVQHYGSRWTRGLLVQTKIACLEADTNALTVI